MTLLYTNEEIARMLAELKPLPLDYHARLRMRPRRDARSRGVRRVGNSAALTLIWRRSIHARTEA